MTHSNDVPTPDEQIRATPLRHAAPTALVVGGSDADREALTGRLQTMGLEWSAAPTLRDARGEIRRRRFDLLLMDPSLPDGNGFEIAASVEKISPHTVTVVFGHTESFGTALQAMRCGAVDYLDISHGLDDMPERLTAAIDRSSRAKHREERFRRLQQICTELSRARAEISEQVETLCQDLGSAYQDLSEHIDDVAIASEFRTLARLDLDVEDLLRTMLEFLLAKIGPTNAAVFLPEGDHAFNLGAYVNYDCPREGIDHVLDHLGATICPELADEADLVSFEDADAFAEWLGLEQGFIAESHIVSFSCRHEGECLAVVVLFRHGSTPFPPEIAPTLDTIRTIFADQLARIIGIHHRGKPEWPDDAHDTDDWDDEYGFGYDTGGLAA